MRQVSPAKTTVRDPATQRELSRIFDHAIHSVEVLKSSDLRYDNDLSRKAIEDEIHGLESRGVFELFDEADIPPDAIILGMKKILAIKDGGTAEGRYKGDSSVGTQRQTKGVDDSRSSPRENEVASSPTEHLVDTKMGCLLYTSPSPRDQRGSRMPSSA